MPQKDFFVTIASGIFIGAVLFDIFPEVRAYLGISQSLLIIALGIILWVALKLITDSVTGSGFAIVSSLGFWFHSFLEGAVTALSFGIDTRIGVLVAIGMLLHLVPEFFAITAILRGEGVSVKKSVAVDFFGIAILFMSFFVIVYFVPGFTRTAASVLGALSGGAFLYIGTASFLKRARNIGNVIGLLLGLGVVFLWNFAALR